MKKYDYQTPVGMIWIGDYEGKISHISFSEIDGEKLETPVIKNMYFQLCEYFDGKRKVFDVPLHIEGTPFQVKVWQVLMKIPYGKTVSYKDIADKIGNPNASRAVGMANNRNKIAIVIPCHRVIASNGDLTGYAGGLDVKKYLIDLENKYFSANKKTL